MGRLLAVVLGLSVLAFIGYRVLYGAAANANANAGEPSRPKQQLENVRGAANRVEAAEQQAADDIAKKAFGE